MNVKQSLKGLIDEKYAVPTTTILPLILPMGFAHVTKAEFCS
jgi:hypothetical protein